MKGFPPNMEERVIQDFVHRVSTDEVLRKELISDPDSVIIREGLSPRVARVVSRLVPHLTLNETGKADSWWYF